MQNTDLDLPTVSLFTRQFRFYTNKIIIKLGRSDISANRLAFVMGGRTVPLYYAPYKYNIRIYKKLSSLEVLKVGPTPCL